MPRSREPQIKAHKIAGIGAKYYVIVILLTLVGVGALPLFGVYGVNNDELVVVTVLAFFMGTVAALRWLSDWFRSHH
jgi:hypothetical protein